MKLQMHSPRIGVAAGLLALSAMQASCGAGSGHDAQVAASVAAPSTPAQAPGDKSVDPSPSALDLFSWAERHYGNFFPVAQVDRQFGAYTFRHYPQTGNYVGVAGSSVYIRGPVAGGGAEPLYLGELKDFTCQVLVSTGCTQWVPRFLSSPLDITVRAPERARFSAEADSPSGQPSYRWQVSRDGGYSFTELPDAVGPSYTTAATSSADNGLLFRVVAGPPEALRVSNAARLTVLPRSSGSDVVGISAGEAHACAVSRSGRVACWGHNVSGQLGDGTRTQRLQPVTVQGLADAVAVAAGDAHTCALRSNGSVVCWGLNLSGQLGVGDTTDRLTPTAVPGLSGVVRLYTFAVGSCAVTTSGEAFCWGSAAGAGSAAPAQLPTRVEALDGLRGRVVGDGLLRCAALASMRVGCWGSGFDAQFRTAVTPVEGAPATQQTALGRSHACVLSAQGGVHCWGGNGGGQLGDGGSTARAAPSATPDLIGMVDVVARHWSSCAVSRAGELVCWGDSFGGLLWPSAARGPTVVPTATPALADHVVMGWGFICQLAASGGAVSCWGANNLGQLGDGGTQSRSTPAEVKGLAEL